MLRDAVIRLKMGWFGGILLVVGLLGVAWWLWPSGQRSSPASDDGVRGDNGDDCWSIYSVEYGHTPQWPMSSVYADAPDDAEGPFGWYVYLLRRGDAVVLVDTGFASQERAESLGFSHFAPPHTLLPEIGIAPEAITHVILTHLHWDHAGDVAAYPNAQFFLQAQELSAARRLVGPGMPENGGVTAASIDALALASEEGRVLIADGDGAILPGLRVHLHGGHTAGLQWVRVTEACGGGQVALLGDLAYTDRNIEELLATGVSSTPDRDVALYTELINELGAASNLLPGHPATPPAEQVSAHISKIR